MEKLFKINFDCGRSGHLSGTFVDTQERVDCLVNKQISVYFGEALGKHSEVYGPISEEEISVVSVNPEIVNAGVESGYNPFDYTFVDFDYATYGIEDADDMTVGELIDIILAKDNINPL
jgi:hypothetical protein